MKPLIKRHFHASGNDHRIGVDVWRCYGDGMAGYGNSPTMAYRSWRVQHDAMVAKRVG